MFERREPQPLDFVTMLGRRDTDSVEYRAMEKPVMILMEKR
jgi:hypothetical protein